MTIFMHSLSCSIHTCASLIFQSHNLYRTDNWLDLGSYLICTYNTHTHVHTKKRRAGGEYWFQCNEYDRSIKIEQRHKQLELSIEMNNCVMDLHAAPVLYIDQSGSHRAERLFTPPWSYLTDSVLSLIERNPVGLCSLSFAQYIFLQYFLSCHIYEMCSSFYICISKWV